MHEQLYKDQYNQEHLKPSISKLLVAPEIYCRAHALLMQVDRVPAPPSEGSPGDLEALLQLLEKKGLAPKVQDADVSQEDLSCVPIRMVGGRLQRSPAKSADICPALELIRLSSMQKAHLAMIDALMTLAARETVSQVKMAPEAEQMGAGAPWENALLFWVNRVRQKDLLDVGFWILIASNIVQLNQKLRELTEEEEDPTPRPQTGSDVQPAQDAVETHTHTHTHTHARANLATEADLPLLFSTCSSVHPPVGTGN